MSSDSEPNPGTSLDISELVRLNEELSQLRESVKRKRREREKARAEGRNVFVDLSPEIQRLNSFLLDLERIAAKLKSIRTARAKQSTQTEMLQDTLGRMKGALEKERKQLELDNITDLREQFAREREQLHTIKDELEKNREQLSKDRGAFEEEKKEFEKLRSSVVKAGAEKKEGEIVVTSTQVPLIPHERPVTEELPTMLGELQKLRENLSKERQILDDKNKELTEEKHRIDEEKRLLEARLRDAEDGRIKYITLKMKNELQSERMELTRLKKSMQQLKTDNQRERRKLEREREILVRTRTRLDNETRKMTQKAALLQAGKIPPGLFEALTEKRRGRQIEDSSRPGTKAKVEKISSPRSGVQTVLPDNAMVLRMRLGEQDYGIDISEVREILRKREITSIPRQPPYVEGVMNVRGSIIPVVNLKKRFGLPGEISSQPHAVIVEAEEGPVGLLVDHVSEVVKIPGEKIHPPPSVASGVGSEYIRGICRVGERLLFYLDIDKVLKEATPIDRIAAGLQGELSPQAERRRLGRDERRVLNAITKTGRGKMSLKEKVGFAAEKLDRLLDSLSRKGLVRVSVEGNRKVIHRIDRG
jgi:purine-binding chemotaxis protein CheW